MVSLKCAIVLNLFYCVIMENYSCNYLKVGSDVLTVYSVVFHDDVVTVFLTAIIIFRSIYLLTSPILLCYFNLQILFNVTIVIYICTSLILSFDESGEWRYVNNHIILKKINLKKLLF